VVREAWRRAVEMLVGDMRAFGRQMRLAFGGGRTRPGLYPYRVEGAGGQRRLHLRVHEDGSGALFVDVSHVIHLTPTAAGIARMLLDGVAAGRVRKQLIDWHPEAPSEQIAADVRMLAGIIEALKQPNGECPTCSPEFERSPIFGHRAQAPYKADLALTYACNNQCAHCYNEPARRETPSLNVAGWRQVLRKLAGIGVPHIIFTGGEPTLCDHLPDLIRCAERLGQVTGVNTNGRRLADAQYARRLKRAGLDHIQVTLASGRARVHNETVGAPALAETVEGIGNCLAAGLHTITNTTLTGRNRDEAVGIVEFVHTLGVTTFAMNGMICAGGGRRNLEALSEAELLPILEQVRDRAEELGMRFLWYTPTEYCRLSPLELGLGAKSCNAAEYSVCVEPNGDVLPCQSYYEPAGNLLRDDWAAIWDSPLFGRIRLRRENPRAGGLDERCYECPDLRVCGGGCPLQREERRKEAAVHVR
jgi:radical SAM protein with 4Fe4S-binding SPASM domain